MQEYYSITGVVVREETSLPLVIEQVRYDYEGYTKLQKVSTTTAMAADDILKNIKANYFRKIPWLHELAEFYKVKGKKIALVGGGPSLKDHLDELKEFDVIFACGSVHDFLVNSGIWPNYAGACDPDPIMANYYQEPLVGTKYLFATGCDPSLFEHLDGYEVIKWNCLSDHMGKEFLELDPNFHAVGGGCTIGLRAISIALTLGYKDIHFFGFDSCISDDEEHHAYGYTEERESTDQGKIYEVRLDWDNNGKPAPKVYKLLGYQLAQVEHFRQFYQVYGDIFTPTFHGDGILPDLWQSMMNNYNGVKVNG